MRIVFAETLPRGLFGDTEYRADLLPRDPVLAGNADKASNPLLVALHLFVGLSQAPEHVPLLHRQRINHPSSILDARQGCLTRAVGQVKRRHERHKGSVAAPSPPLADRAAR